MEEADEEDEAQMKQAEEKEKLMTGLITLLRKIISKADSEMIDRVIVQQDLISKIFKDFLFASYFAALDN